MKAIRPCSLVASSSLRSWPSPRARAGILRRRPWSSRPSRRSCRSSSMRRRCSDRRSSSPGRVPERGPNGEAVVILPAGGDRGASSPARWPLVVALHGRGEALKSPRDGAMGWARDYALVRADFAREQPAARRGRRRGVRRSGAARFVQPPARRSAPSRGSSSCARTSPTPTCGATPTSPTTRATSPTCSCRARARSSRFCRRSGGDRDRRRVARRRDRAADRVRADRYVRRRGGVAAGDRGRSERRSGSSWPRPARAKRPDMPLRLTTSHEDLYHDAITHLSTALRSAAVRPRLRRHSRPARLPVQPRARARSSCSSGTIASCRGGDR